MYLQTQLQNGADALALAAAAELDRTPTAIERAFNAIEQVWERIQSEREGRGIKFLSSLPVTRQRPDFAGTSDERSDAGCVCRGHGRADHDANNFAGLNFRRLQCR